MKTEEQIKDQANKLQAQLDRVMKHLETADKSTIETKSMYGWAKCIESGIVALHWALDNDEDDLVY